MPIFKIRSEKDRTRAIFRIFFKYDSKKPKNKTKSKTPTMPNQSNGRDLCEEIQNWLIAHKPKEVNMRPIRIAKNIYFSFLSLLTLISNTYFSEDSHIYLTTNKDNNMTIDVKKDMIIHLFKYFCKLRTSNLYILY